MTKKEKKKNHSQTFYFVPGAGSSRTAGGGAQCRFFKALVNTTSKMGNNVAEPGKKRVARIMGFDLPGFSGGCVRLGEVKSLEKVLLGENYVSGRRRG